jgi:hypothetical protein
VVAERALGVIALEVIVATAATLVSMELRRAAIEAAGLRLRGGLVAQEKVGRAFNAVAAQISVAASATISGMALVVATILAWPVFSPSPYPKGKDQAHILSYNQTAPSTRTSRPPPASPDKLPEAQYEIFASLHPPLIQNPKSKIQNPP